MLERERQDAGEAVSFVCSTTAFLIEHRILLNFGTDCDCRICLNKYNPKANHSKREDATFKMHTAIDLHLRNDMKGAMGYTKYKMNGKRIKSEPKQPTNKDSTKIAQG